MCIVGVHAWPGGLHGKEASMAGGMHARRGVHCSRWYAFFWNVFLLLNKIEQKLCLISGINKQIFLHYFDACEDAFVSVENVQ